MTEQEVLDEIQCPICIETLKKPIRILACGHNLCQSCLLDLCRPEAVARCPICRQPIQFGPNGIEGLARNHVVENMIDKFPSNSKEQLQYHSSSSSPSTSGISWNKAINQYEGINNMQIKYQNGYESFQIAFRPDNELSKIPQVAATAKDLIGLGKIKEAKKFAFEIICIIDSIRDENALKWILEKGNQDIKALTEKFSEVSSFYTTISLVKCLFKVSSTQEVETKLSNLKQLGFVLQNAAGKMKRAKKSKHLNDLLDLMNKMLREMQNVNDVDVKVKCLEVVWFLKYYGVCCGIAKRYTKSLIVHSEAISAMKTVFGQDACKYKVFGFCYHNLAIALEKLHKNKYSKISFVNASAIYHSATDWEDNSEKSVLLSRVSKYTK